MITAPARSGIFVSSSRKTGISFVFLTSTGSWAAVVPSSQIPDSSIGARPPRAAPRTALPSIRRWPRMPGRSARARAADHAHSASSYWPWSPPARPRPMVVASGRRGFPSVSSGAPSLSSSSSGAVAAHSAAASSSPSPAMPAISGSASRYSSG